MTAEFDDYDEFDELRERSARRAAAYENVDFSYEDEPKGFLSRFTSGQKLILAIFLIIDIFLVGYVLLVLAGSLPYPF
ncbi:MAG: hypothetical protein AAF902_04755 [Chloroflexota bacterium]